MAKGIILDDNISRRKMITLNFELYLDVILEPVTSQEAAVEYLKKYPNLPIIVCQNNIGTDYTVLKTFAFIKSNNLDIPLICLGECSKLESEKNVKIVGDVANDLKGAISWAAKKLSITAEMMAFMDTEDHYPISTHHFYLISEAPCDIFYLTTDKKPVPQVTKGTVITREMVNNWIIDKKTTLHVNKYDRLKFVNHLTLDAIGIIRSSTSKRSERVSATQAVFEESKMLLSDVGMDEKAFALATEAINSLVTIAKGTDELAELLALLENSGAGYLYKHSVLAATLGHHCVKFLKWVTPQQREVICFVAFFHDITLLDDVHAQISNARMFKESSFSEMNKKIIETHAFRASQLIQDYPKVPFGAPEIILQHHGMPNGIGFAVDLTSRISPLAAVFQVVEYMVDQILATPKGEKFDAQVCLAGMNIKFNKGHYKETVTALESIQKTLKLGK
ncbi:MAG: hypothetical protein A2X86_01000 [Bdellovibrionales bacterium GWA2_49_15]|nr:MAG: hypothetical protein A2X86_01000 [Bdellovibrionales bacterium GWA2_49_15]HAZ11751.1 hypothetical protein [Bdellovibrionales bacterium]